MLICHRHAALQLFRPVEDNPDLLRGRCAELRLSRIDEAEEVLAVPAHVASCARTPGRAHEQPRHGGLPKVKLGRVVTLTATNWPEPAET